MSELPPALKTLPNRPFNMLGATALRINILRMLAGVSWIPFIRITRTAARDMQ